MQALAGALARPFWVNDQVVQVGVTAGLAHAPRDAQSRDELIRRADLALRAAKRKQRGGVVAFRAGAWTSSSTIAASSNASCKRALGDKALDVHYQPIVSADGARIVGAEALLRWNHPERGAIPPAEFVAVAEQCGLMGRLGEFVLRRALSDARRWPEPVHRRQSVAGAGARSGAGRSGGRDAGRERHAGRRGWCWRSPRAC